MKKVFILLLSLFIYIHLSTTVIFAQTVTPKPTITPVPTLSARTTPTPTLQPTPKPTITVVPTSTQPTPTSAVSSQQNTQPTPTSIPPTPELLPPPAAATPTPTPVVPGILSIKNPPHNPPSLPANVAGILTVPFAAAFNELPGDFYSYQGLSMRADILLLSLGILFILLGYLFYTNFALIKDFYRRHLSSYQPNDSEVFAIPKMRNIYYE